MAAHWGEVVSRSAPVPVQRKLSCCRVTIEGSLNVIYPFWGESTKITHGHGNFEGFPLVMFGVGNRMTPAIKGI